MSDTQQMILDAAFVDRLKHLMVRYGESFQEAATGLHEIEAAFLASCKGGAPGDAKETVFAGSLFMARATLASLAVATERLS